MRRAHFYKRRFCASEYTCTLGGAAVSMPVSARLAGMKRVDTDLQAFVSFWSLAGP